MHSLAKAWLRRQPETTVLYRVLAQHLETFLARTHDDDDRGPLPRFVVRELRDFLTCGLLARGFCRVHCAACGKDDLVAFACKRRGICPSCGARRRADTAAWLVDRVFPDVPVRQWVLSLPHRVRWACAFDHATTQGVRRIFVRALASFYGRDARTRGIANARAGAVVATQRFDSAYAPERPLPLAVARRDVTCAPRQPEAAFHPARPITDEDVEHLVRQIRSRMLRYLRKTGKLTDHDAGDVDAHDASLFDTLRAASIAGRTALGPRAGRSDPRIGQGSAESSDFARGRLCANLDGFSLHAAVRVDGCNSERLERLCRYALRPPIVHERLSLTSDGKVLCKFKRRWRDGSTHVVLDPITLIERLTALIPAPRKKLVSYHGVFAPAFPLRHTVVPPPQEAAVSQPQVEHSASPGTEVVVRVLDGRYGPYVTDGETNATVLKDESPDSMTMARALEPIEARAARGPAKKKGRRSAGAKKPPARKKCAPRSSPLRPSARPDASPRVRKPRPQAPTLAADLRVAATEPAWLRARPVVR